MTGFNRHVDGQLYCDNLSVKEIAQRVNNSPFSLMSKAQLKKNFLQYQTAIQGLNSFVGYIVKANHNLHVLRYLAEMGSGAVVSSINELEAAL